MPIRCMNILASISCTPSFLASSTIFEAMSALTERSQPIDLVTLKDELVRASALEAVGGAAYLGSLVDGVPRLTNVEPWSRIIKEKAVLRNLIHASNRIVQSCYEAEDDAATILDRAEQSIFQIAERRIRQGFVALKEIVKESFRTIDQLSQSKDVVTGLPTGFVDLDERTSGLQKGDLIIVAARPAMGKTSLCLNIAQNSSQRTGETVGVFSLEMSKEQLVLRMLCADARVDAHKLRTGNLGEKDWARLAKAYADLSASKIFIDDSATLTPLEMRAKCRRLKAEHGLGLVVVDYLQLVSGAGRVENRQQEIASISRSLKGLAKELECPVMALSQLSRAPEARQDRRPQLSDLRESGAIEQDADIVMFIYREEEHKPTDENRGIAEIIIGKQRNGPTGTVKLFFNKPLTKFDNLAPGSSGSDY